MSQFEAARIKILDKNTRQVIKEIDALTSDEAVYCDNGSITLKDKLKSLQNQSDNSSSAITTLIKNYDQNFQTIEDSISKNLELINDIKNQNIIYDQKFLDIDKKINDTNTEIGNIKKDYNNHILNYQLYQKEISDNLTTINNKNTEQDKAITNLNNTISNLSTNLNKLSDRFSGSSKIYSQAGDPGNIAKNGDLWYDVNNNVFKSRVNNTWKIVGAAYN